MAGSHCDPASFCPRHGSRCEEISAPCDYGWGTALFLALGFKIQAFASVLSPVEQCWNEGTYPVKNSSRIKAQALSGSFRIFTGARLAACLFAAGSLSGNISGQDAGGSTKAVQPKQPAVAAAPSAAELEATVTAARERAKLLHDVYSTTLDAIHHHYFRRDDSVIPARAMETVFEGMAGLSGSMANWISVNTPAMSTDHKPRTEFEKTAAAEITAGKEAYELVGKHFYRRAARIPLGSNCIGCHAGMLATTNKSPSWAALVISIPLHVEKK